MSYLKGLDVSHWNNYVPGSEDFVMIKMSGGDAGLYMDSSASKNYTAAVGAGKVVGGYHFAGGGDPIAEADYFVRAMSPVAENDVYALDWEIQHTDPVDWCLQFVNEVHDKVGVWPLIYLNISTTNGYDWSPVLANCGLWLAAPSYSFDSDAPISHTYVMQQGPIVNGIDSDAFFGSREELQAYGYHAPAATPPPPSTVISPTITDVTPPPSPAEPVTPPITPPTPSKPTPPSGQGSGTNHEQVIEKDVKIVLGKYNKLIVAVVGASVTYLTVHYGSTSWLPTVTLVLTALGVYQAPNIKS